jgi:hypothetical protein
MVWQTMNERIKQLAEQAGMVIVDDEFSTYGKFAEKFAELIVRECIDVAFDRGDNVDYFKDHFGVES